MPSGEKMMLAFSRSSPFGHGIVRAIFFDARSYWTSVGGPISQRSPASVYFLMRRIRYLSSGSGVRPQMRVLAAPSVSVKLSMVVRLTRSMISTFS